MTAPNHSPRTPAPTEEALVDRLRQVGTGENMVDRVNELARLNRSIAFGPHLIEQPGRPEFDIAPAPGFVPTGPMGDNQ